MLSLLVLLSSAQADVLAPPPAGMEHADHSVRIEGLDAFPDTVIIAFDGEPGGQIGGYRVFKSGGSNEQTMARGAARSNDMHEPGFYAMPLDSFTTWSQATSQEVMRQRTACEQGEGCAHISRFSPRYPSPEGVVSCEVRVPLVIEVEAGKPTTRTDVFTLTAVDAESCRLQAPSSSTATMGPAPKPQEGEARGPEVGMRPEAAERECSAVGSSAASLLAGLCLVAVAGRRRRR